MLTRQIFEYELNVNKAQLYLSFTTLLNRIDRTFFGSLESKTNTRALVKLSCELGEVTQVTFIISP